MLAPFLDHCMSLKMLDLFMPCSAQVLNAIKYFAPCRLAICLVEANGDNASPASKRIEGIIEELVTFFCYLAASHPKKVSAFKYLKLEEDA